MSDANKSPEMITATIILEQLGGGRFKMMTGAKNFITNGNDLTFSLPGADGFCKDGINRVNIALTPSDTYTVKFYRLRGAKLTVVSEHGDVHCNNLREVFEQATGLTTRMPRIIGL